MKSSLQNKITIKNTIKNTLASPAIIKAIEAYDLKRFVYTQVPPTKYVSGKRDLSMYQFKFSIITDFCNPFFKASLQDQVRTLERVTKQDLSCWNIVRFGSLSSKANWKADFSWFDKAVEEARTTKTPTSVAKMMKLKKQYEDEQKAIERKREKDAKAAEFAAKVENAKRLLLMKRLVLLW